jgi:hypothetical protein
MPRTLGDVHKETLDKKALLAEMGGKLDTVRDLLITTTAAVMSGDKSTALNDLLEAYETATEVMTWIDQERGASGPSVRNVTEQTPADPTMATPPNPFEF